MTSLPASLRRNCQENKARKSSSSMFVSTGLAAASGPRCCSAGSSDLDEIRSNTLKEGGGKEHRASFFLVFSCQETAVDITSTFFNVYAHRRNFCIRASHSVFISHACAGARYIDGSGLSRLHAGHEWRSLKGSPPPTPRKRKAVLDTSKQK